MYRIKKVICCVIVLAILGSMPVNAKEVLQNENEAWDIEKGNARTILIIISSSEITKVKKVLNLSRIQHFLFLLYFLYYTATFDTIRSNWCQIGAKNF